MKITTLNQNYGFFYGHSIKNNNRIMNNNYIIIINVYDYDVK